MVETEAPAQSAPATILITGATGGIGAALARSFATPGRTLILHGRDVLRQDILAHTTEGVTIYQRSPLTAERWRSVGAATPTQYRSKKLRTPASSAGAARLRSKATDPPFRVIRILVA